MGESVNYLSARDKRPIEDVNPFMSNVSLKDIGIPYKGGKYFSESKGPSKSVQFFFPFRFLSHSSAIFKAGPKILSVMRQSYWPTVPALKERATTIC